MFTQPPQPQLLEQVRRCCCVPQFPHATVRVWVAPTAQTPCPVQVEVSPQAPQPQLPEQVRRCVLLPQLPQPTVWFWVELGAHTPWPSQPPTLDHPGHEQLAPHVRVWVCDPQLPHATSWVAVVPVLHTPSPPQLDQLPHVHTLVQLRERVPQSPQASDSTWPGLHAVLSVPEHVPSRHTSPTVHAAPSLQLVPLATGLHAAWPIAGVHAWQLLPGCGVPESTHDPSMTQASMSMTLVHMKLSVPVD